VVVAVNGGTKISQISLKISLFVFWRWTRRWRCYGFGTT